MNLIAYRIFILPVTYFSKDNVLNGFLHSSRMSQGKYHE